MEIFIFNARVEICRMIMRKTNEKPIETMHTEIICVAELSVLFKACDPQVEDVKLPFQGPWHIHAIST